MKKLLLGVAFFLLLAIGVLGQDTTINGVQYKALPDSAKLTMSKVYGDVKAGLAGLASALKVGAEHVYFVLVKQQIVKSVIYSVILLIIIVIFSFSVGIFRKNYANLHNKDHIWFRRDITEQWATCIPAILGIVSFVAFWITIGATGEIIITGFINPEYGAIKDIFEFIK